MIRITVVASFVLGLTLGIFALAWGFGQILNPGFISSAGNPIGDRFLGVLMLSVGICTTVIYFLSLFVIDGGAWYRKNWHQ